VSPQDWDAVKDDLQRHNVRVISVEGEEVNRTRNIATS